MITARVEQANFNHVQLLNISGVKVMFLKILIISVILVALVLIAMGIRLFFNKNAEFPAHSCALEDGSLDETGACLKCELKDLANCPDKSENH